MKYTVVSAVYNVEKYLDKYFNSLVNQTLEFEKYITVILVDDGSTDTSAEIIRKWMKKYPNNIMYLYQKNMGQAVARNHGIKQVKTLWVTFIDPDDFISKQYFENVNSVLVKNKNEFISMISCKIVYYFEHLKLSIDHHPLRYNFKKQETIVKIENLEKEIQCSSSTTFFNTELLDKCKLEFNPKIRPNFEDGHFIGRYLLEYPQASIMFLSKPKYFYRKRRNNSSTLDRSWKDSRKYNELLRFGYIDMLNMYKQKLGYVPIFMQRTILYDLIWHYKILIDTPEMNDFLTPYQQKQYKSLLALIFEYIDVETIMDFELAGCSFYHKVGFISQYKEGLLPYQIVYIDKIIKNKMMYFHYYSYNDTSCYTYLDDIKIKGSIINQKEISFMNEKFIIRHNIKLKLDKNSKKLKVIIDGLPTYINNIGNDMVLIKNIKIKKFTKVKSFLKNIVRKVFL